ncbi:S1/P1 nuclease [Thalassotalea sp. ND16A]|uniref:S1/P1 nuclease n=1 Tax=Thalassotalea sp. ND16A TaxID=1535422 RepID=UPI00051A3C91|nr:S1/P1 nuclease [Thalassotalea sp. ND16A]KGJ92168.1 hypothetical protein ND16A_1687 [Thalassotalea sp. ND16A]
MKFTCLIFAMIFSTKIVALGSKGHWLVCQLAFEQLTTQQQNSINELLTHLPAKEVRLLNSFLHKKSTAAISFAEACSWADAIKNQTPYTHFKAWHFVNLAREQKQVNAFACQNNCVLDAISFHQQQFLLVKTAQKKIQALLFLAHWLGDIHQPLHVSYRSDLGGNKTKVIAKNRACKNLHQIWDSCLLAQLTKQQWLLQLTTPLNFSASDELSAINIQSWANESFAISRRPSVGYCQPSKTNSSCLASLTPIKFDQAYKNQHTPLLTLRIQQAARRLWLFLSTHI